MNELFGQLQSETGGGYYHSLLLVERRAGELLVAAHTFDALRRPLSSYSFARARYLHIV